MIQSRNKKISSRYFERLCFRYNIIMWEDLRDVCVLCEIKNENQVRETLQHQLRSVVFQFHILLKQPMLNQTYTEPPPRWTNPTPNQTHAEPTPKTNTLNLTNPHAELNQPTRWTEPTHPPNQPTSSTETIFVDTFST